MNTPQEFVALHAGLQRLAVSNLAYGGALATLVRTRGPTFRRPGARMLVCGDGSVVRDLSGGCPEADIIARAQEVIADGEPRLLRYDREHGLDALIELGCGGELEVLVEPLTNPRQLQFADAVTHCLQRRQAGFLATLFAHNGQILQPQRLVWSADAVLTDDFTPAGLSEAAIARGVTLSARAAPESITLQLPNGQFDVMFESLTPPHALALIGVNSTSLALARIAAGLGWIVHLVDHRADTPTDEPLSAGVQRLQATAATLTQAVSLDAHSFAVVMTHNLERDIEYLRTLAPIPLAYLGAIGSRNRALQLIQSSGLRPPRLHAPAGLNLGAETPEEIALSIVAEMLATAAGRDASSLSASDGPMH